jgi:hypothetical protein
LPDFAGFHIRFTQLCSLFSLVFICSLCFVCIPPYFVGLSLVALCFVLVLASICAGSLPFAGVCQFRFVVYRPSFCSTLIHYIPLCSNFLFHMYSFAFLGCALFLLLHLHLQEKPLVALTFLKPMLLHSIHGFAWHWFGGCRFVSLRSHWFCRIVLHFTCFFPVRFILWRFPKVPESALFLFEWSPLRMFLSIPQILCCSHMFMHVAPFGFFLHFSSSLRAVVVELAPFCFALLLFSFFFGVCSLCFGFALLNFATFWLRVLQRCFALLHVAQSHHASVYCTGSFRIAS